MCPVGKAVCSHDIDQILVDNVRVPRPTANPVKLVTRNKQGTAGDRAPVPLSAVAEAADGPVGGGQIHEL